MSGWMFQPLLAAAADLSSGGAVQAPFAAEDWPRPADRKRALLDTTAINRLPLITPPVDNNTYILRPVLRVSIPRLARLPAETVVNRLPLIAVAASAPFVSDDWPLAARSRRRADLQAEANRLPLISFVAPAPFIPKDFPLPARKAANSASQGHLDLSRTQYIPPPRIADWPKPAARRASLQADSESSYTGLINPVPDIRPPDVPNARRRAAAQQTEPFIGALRFPAVAAGAPFAQLDWPTPATRRQKLEGQVSRGPVDVEYVQGASLVHRIPRKPLSQQPEQVINQLLLGIVASAVPPISQKDWPNAKLKAHSQRGDADRGAIRLPVEVPVRPVDMPLPKRRISQLAEPILPGALLLPAPVVGTPFNQLDWPAASRLRRMVQSEITVNLPLQAGVVNTFGQDDWPVAARTKRSATVDLIANRLPLTFVAPVVRPFVTTDWPLARRTSRQGIPVDLLPLILSLTGSGFGTVTHRGAGGTNTLPHGAAAAATDRVVGNVATDRGPNTAADDRLAGTPATGRSPGTTATPR